MTSTFWLYYIKFDFDKLRVSLLAIIHLFSEVISVVIFL